MYNYPYGDTQQLNLDWFLTEFQNLVAAWEQEKAGIDGALDAEIAKAEAALADVFAARDAAATSAQNAAQSAQNAATSASDASGYLATVDADATAARNAASNANRDATAASGSAQNATTSAQNAATSAQNAAQSAITATGKAAEATQANTLAQAAAGVASDKADAAAQSATDAETAATGVEESAAQITQNASDIADLKNAKADNLISKEDVPANDILDFGQHEFVVKDGKLVFGSRAWYYHWYINCAGITYVMAGFRVHSSSESVPHLVYTDDDLNVISALDARLAGAYSDVETRVPSGATRCYVQSQDSRSVNVGDSTNKMAIVNIIPLSSVVTANSKTIETLSEENKQYAYEGEKIVISPLLKYKQIGYIERGYSQGAACYGKYLFQFHSQNQNPDANYHGCTIYDLDENTEVQFIDLGYNVDYHNNNASFGVEKYSASDTFPLLYVSQESDATHGCLVYRVTETTNTSAPFALTLVQTITAPSNIAYPQFVVDPDGYLWIFAVAPNNLMVGAKFTMPSLSDSHVVLTNDDKISDVSFTRIAHPQGAVIHGGKVYYSQGDSASTSLQAVDLSTGNVLSTIRFSQCGLSYEPEGVFVYKEMLGLSFSTGYTTVYAFTF